MSLAGGGWRNRQEQQEGFVGSLVLSGWHLGHQGGMLQNTGHVAITRPHHILLTTTTIILTIILIIILIIIIITIKLIAYNPLREY